MQDYTSVTLYEVMYAVAFLQFSMFLDKFLLFKVEWELVPSFSLTCIYTYRGMQTQISIRVKTPKLPLLADRIDSKLLTIKENLKYIMRRHRRDDQYLFNVRMREAISLA